MLRFFLIILSMFVCFSPFLAHAQSAIGRTANYANSWPVINWETDNTIAVGVHDQRPYVVDGEKSPTYVGTMRGGFYNPWNMNTLSNKPLADDITSAVTAGFKRIGTSTEPISILFSDSRQVVIEKLRHSGAKRLILLTLGEWRSDTYTKAHLFVEATAIVYDGAGKELANSAISHKDLGLATVR